MRISQAKELLLDAPLESSENATEGTYLSMYRSVFFIGKII